FEKKFSDSELLIDSLHRKVNELKHFESIARSQQDYEFVLSTIREKHEQEIISFNEKLQNMQMILKEKNVEIDELRVQLDVAYINNEKAILERINTINHLNEQLHDCQQKYSDLLSTNLLESVNQTEIKRQLTNMTEDKEKLKNKCQDLQSEVRTLREHLGENENEINNDIFSIKNIPISNHDSNEKLPLDGLLINENIRLRTLIDEFESNEKHLIELNEELQRKLQDYGYSSKRTESSSSSSSSSSSNETVITTSIHMEKIKELTNQIEILKRNYTDLEEKYEYEKHELQTMLEELREDVIELEKTKQLYNDFCQENLPMEDKFRTKFEFELKTNLDDLRRILEEDYNEKLLSYKTNQEKLEQDNQNLKIKYNQDLEQQSKEFYEEMEAIKITHEKQIIELNNEIDRLRANEDANSRLEYTEKEFEQLKHDYYDLNIKQKELLKSYSTLENQNQNLLNAIEQIEKEKNQLKENFTNEEEKLLNEIKQLNELNQNQNLLNAIEQIEKEKNQLKENFTNTEEKLLNEIKELNELNQNQNLLNAIEQIEKEKNQLKENFTNEEEKFLNEIKELNELNQHQQEELLSIQKQTSHNQNNLKQDIQSLQLRINHYENTITQYEEFRLKFEDNLQKITQQRDRNKIDLKLTQEILKTKEDEYNQLKLNFDQYEKHLQDNQKQFTQYETTINDLQQQIKQYEIQIQELNQTLPAVNQNIEIEYREKLMSLDIKKNQLEQGLQEATRALNLADCHLQQEISKIKLNLEQEYSRRYEQDLKQHQYELNQLRQKLTKEIENKRKLIAPINLINNSQQDMEEIKKMYRTEIDRLYHENVELSQHQAKLIDTHQKQMDIMKTKLDNGYNHVINEFQREQTHLQTRCDQLKQQLLDSQQTIEQLKLNLNRLKRNHFNDLSKIKETHTNEYDNKHQQDNQQNRLENLVKLREQPTNALNKERTLDAKQVNEYQETITPLQEKINDIRRPNIKATNEIKLELTKEHLIHQRHVISRPISVAESVQSDSSTNDTNSDSKITNEKLRGNDPIKRKGSSVVQSRVRPDTIIDMHVFELDRLLSQMAQDCLDSFPTSSSNSSILSFPITFQHRQNRSIVYDSSLSNKSAVLSRKSIECLYMTPTINKPPVSLAPHDHVILDNDCRPKSASNILIACQNPTSSIISSPYTHKYQQLKHRYFQKKIFRSENDLMFAMQRNEQQKLNSNNKDDTLTLCENDQEHRQANVRALAKEYEQKTNSVSDYSHVKPRTTNVHYATARTIVNDQQEQNDDDDEEELTWPKEPVSIAPSTHTSGIKKFVNNGLKLFIIQPQEQKRSGK
ncbi:unnamed protein product, partial [Rotaria sp. Silwood1]